MINFSDMSTLFRLIRMEISSLSSTLDIQKKLNKQILTFMKNFIGELEISTDINPRNKFYKYLNDSTSALNQSNENIQNIQKLLNTLQEIEKDFKEDVADNIIKEEVEAYNIEYNERIDIIYKNTNTIEKFVHKISKIDLADLQKELNGTKKPKKAPVKEKGNPIAISSDELNSSFVENTLIISEVQGKVILPYKLTDLREILLNNEDKYNSIEDVIQKLFTIPISNYKVPSVARFKEAYKLMIEKERAPKIKALSLASELFSNYNLHPAIITACKSLDELDIYLVCLEDNTLEDFHFFDIKYEIPPKTVKAKNLQ